MEGTTTDGRIAFVQGSWHKDLARRLTTGIEAARACAHTVEALERLPAVTDAT